MDARTATAGDALAADPAARFDPRVALGPELRARAARWAGELAAPRAAGEGRAPSRLAGAGQEFAAHRPWRPGEDLRRLDWDLLARLDRPFVRVARRETGERWSIALDSSASMGVAALVEGGALRSKLQAACEVAGALCAAGARLGARVRLHSRAQGAPLAVRSPSEVARAWEHLAALRAAGDAELERSLAPELARGAARVFVIGDLWSVDPRAWLALGARGRRLAALQLFAPHERAPDGAPARLVDPESGAALEVAPSAGERAAYDALLAERLAAWEGAAARHGAAFASAGCELALEELLGRWLGR